MLAYLAFKAIHRLVLVLPRGLCYWIAVRIADADYLLRKKTRNAVKSNIRHVLSNTTAKVTEPLESDIQSYSREVFRNFAKYLVDFFSFSRLDSGNINKFVKIEGLDYIYEALKKGKGVIALTAHLGNWELSGVVMALLGFPVDVIALNHENTRINRLFVNQRAMKGVNVIPVGTNSMQYIRALKKNHLIGLVGDRLTSDAGIEIEFFGKPTVVPRGPSVLSLRTGALIAPSFMIRTPSDNFNMVFEEPIEPDDFKESDMVKSEKLITQKIISVLEKYISRYPSQWFLFYKVWG